VVGNETAKEGEEYSTITEGDDQDLPDERDTNLNHQIEPK